MAQCSGGNSGGVGLAGVGCKMQKPNNNNNECCGEQQQIKGSAQQRNQWKALNWRGRQPKKWLTASQNAKGCTETERLTTTCGAFVADLVLVVVELMLDYKVKTGILARAVNSFVCPCEQRYLCGEQLLEVRDSKLDINTRVRSRYILYISLYLLFCISSRT